MNNYANNIELLAGPVPHPRDVDLRATNAHQDQLLQLANEERR